jgi:hypothetical protein
MCHTRVSRRDTTYPHGQHPGASHRPFSKRGGGSVLSAPRQASFFGSRKGKSPAPVTGIHKTRKRPGTRRFAAVRHEDHRSGISAAAPSFATPRRVRMAFTGVRPDDCSVRAASPAAGDGLRIPTGCEHRLVVGVVYVLALRLWRTVSRLSLWLSAAHAAVQPLPPGAFRMTLLDVGQGLSPG